MAVEAAAGSRLLLLVVLEVQKRPCLVATSGDCLEEVPLRRSTWLWVKTHGTILG